MQPGAFNDYVIIGEGEDFSRRLTNSRVESKRFALPRFTKIAKSARVAMAKILHHGIRLIAGVVVNHQDFPRHAGGKLRNREALESLPEIPAAVMSAQDDGNLHAYFDSLATELGPEKLNHCRRISTICPKVFHTQHFR